MNSCESVPQWRITKAMQLPSAIFTLALFLGTTSAFPQGEILRNSEPQAAGFSTKEDLTIRLEDGTFRLGVGDKAVAGTARAFIHDNATRTQQGGDRLAVEVHESLRNIVLSMGTGGKGKPKDTPGHLTGKNITGSKVDGHWKFNLASKEKPEAAEATALRQFAAYIEVIEALGELYGPNPRSVGDTWKPDLSALKNTAVAMDADLQCKLEEVSEKDGDRIARISVSGQLTGEVGQGNNVSIKIAGTILRSLRDMVDTEMEMSGTFKYNGIFGKNADTGAKAEIAAPLKVKRTVKVLKR
jgi:hypothetical protein